MAIDKLINSTQGDSIIAALNAISSKVGSPYNLENKLNPAYINYDSTHAATPETVANSGITSTDVAQIEMNKNNILYNTFLGRKNALKLQFDSSAISAYGLTFTKNADGTLTVSGTYNGSAASYAPFIGSATLPAGTYMLSGCPSGGGESTWQLDMISPSYVNDVGNGAQFTLTQTTIIQIRCRIATTETLSKTFYPMITLKSIYDNDSTFERYAMSNAELTELSKWNYTETRFTNTGTSDYKNTGISFTAHANQSIEFYAYDRKDGAYLDKILVCDSLTTLGNTTIVSANSIIDGFTDAQYWTLQTTGIVPTFNTDVTYYIWVKRKSTGSNLVGLAWRYLSQ